MSDKVTAVLPNIDISDWKIGVDFRQEWVMAPRRPRTFDCGLTPREWEVLVQRGVDDFGDNRRRVTMTLTKDDVEGMVMQLEGTLKDMEEMDEMRVHVQLDDRRNARLQEPMYAVGQCTPYRARMTRPPAGPIESASLGMGRSLLENTRRLAGIHHGGGIDE